MIIIDSLCICLFALERVMLSLVCVSFKCLDINTEGCCVTLTTEWSSLRASTWMCSDECVMHSGSRYESCAFCSANKKCASNNDRTACRGWTLGPIGFHMTSKWATWGAVKVSVRPRTWHDVAKVVPRSIFPVPIKQFWFILGTILMVFGH